MPSSSGPNELTVARTCAPSSPDSDRNSTGWPDGSNVQAQRLQPLVDLRTALAGLGEPRQVALDVGDEDRDAGLRQLTGEHLERLRLAGAGRARDQPVTVQHRQRDLHPHFVEQLPAVHRTADDQRGLVERVTRP